MHPRQQPRTSRPHKRRFGETHFLIAFVLLQLGTVVSSSWHTPPFPPNADFQIIQLSATERVGRRDFPKARRSLRRRSCQRNLILRRHLSTDGSFVTKSQSCRNLFFQRTKERVTQSRSHTSKKRPLYINDDTFRVFLVPAHEKIFLFCARPKDPPNS